VLGLNLNPFEEKKQNLHPYAANMKIEFPNFCCESLKKEKGEFWKQGFYFGKKKIKLRLECASNLLVRAVYTLGTPELIRVLMNSM